MTKKKAKNKTYVAIILDRSGSMDTCWQAAKDSYKEQLQALEDGTKDDMETLVSLFTFDTFVERQFELTPVKEVSKILSVSPRGMTALYDAVGDAIKHLEVQPAEGNVAYLVCIITDGMENNSSRYTQEQIAEKIQMQQKSGKWTFTYMGANQDLSVVQKNLNIPKGNIQGWVSSNNTDAKATMSVQSASIGNYMSTRSSGVTFADSFYHKDGGK